MKAVVMAGGEGTRLRPLTEGRPKPMVELLGKPVLERTVESLARQGFREICFTLRYLPRTVQDHFGGGERLGVHLEYRVETAPLGTAGGVRACRDFAGGDDLLVMSGDAVWGFDLKLLAGKFRRSGAEAMIVLKEDPAPTRFGLVLTDSEGRVTGFSEKPAWDRVVTSMVNTGIYFLKPDILDLIPEEGEYDFGRDLFPRLVREGRGLYAFPAEGYWCDVGSPEAYRQCCVDALAGRTGMDLGLPEISPGVFSRVPLTGVRVTPPVYVGEGCVVVPGARLGPDAVLSSGSHVGRGSAVSGSVLNGAHVGAGCRIEGTILGRDSVISDGVRTGRGAVVGDGARIGGGAVIAPGVKIWSDRSVPEGVRVSRSITADTPALPAAFVSGGALEGTLGIEMTPEAAVALGAVLGENGARVGTSHCGGEGARLIADAVLSGATCSGGEGAALDCDFEAELAGSCRLFALSQAAFVRQEGDRIRVSFFTGSGVPVDTQTRRRLEAALTGGRPRTAARVGGISTVTGAARAYISGVIDELHSLVRSPRGVTVAVRGSGAENRALRCVLAGLGNTVRAPGPGTASFSAGRGGTELAAVDERGRRFDWPHTLVLAAQAAMRLGARSLALPDSAPEAAGRLGERYGCRVVRGDRELWESQRYLRDAALAAALIAAAMGTDGVELARLADDLPPFALRERRVTVDIPRAKAMRVLADAKSEFAADLTGGLTLSDRHGSVRVAPSFDGSALVLRAEAQNAELADELCAKCEKLTLELAKRP